jgi:voltage-gated potassium channel
MRSISLLSPWRRLAQSMLRPNVTDFIDLTMYTHDMALRLDEIMVTEKAPINGKTLMQSN